MATGTTPKEGIALPPASAGGQRLKLAIAATVLAVAFGYFAFTAFQSAKVYYVTVGDVLAQSPQGQMVRVSGKLAPDSFQRTPGETLALFSLTDGSQALKVQYDGVIPDLFFNPQSDIVAEGANQGNGTFLASAILVKCPSKYVAVQES
ncbi:MAG: cytochrome c maturation protein CcmE [Dehalococcoidia bacterium]|nr:cytochrome c maturation protein CcmE [Dehalococcoidia bacterium]